MKPKYFIFLLLAMVSCGPSTFTMSVEMRQPSRSGLELGRKTFSVAYLDNGDKADSVFIASVSEGFAQRLESEYFAGEQEIGLYNIDKDDALDYTSKETMVDLLMTTGTDVVFLFDAPKLGSVTLKSPTAVAAPTTRDSAFVVEAQVPFSFKLYVYDSMNENDKVLSFNGASTAAPVAYTDGTESQVVLTDKIWAAMGEPGREFGRLSGSSFLPQWAAENFRFMYYDSGSSWLNAAYAALSYEWQEAIQIWTSLADSKNQEKRSCASYNLATAFYILGVYDLAKDWLDVSDAAYPLHLSYDLRKKIEAKL